MPVRPFRPARPFPVLLFLLVLLALGVMGLPPGAHAAPFRLASQDDAATIDPPSFNHATASTLLGHIDEGLVRRDRDQRVEPALAQSWTQPAPTTWRFRLREGVRFHDGSALSPDDVVFSL